MVMVMWKWRVEEREGSGGGEGLYDLSVCCLFGFLCAWDILA